VKISLSVLDAFEQNGKGALRKLSDHILADGALKNDKSAIRLAIIAHALSNVLEKAYYRTRKSVWERFSRKIREGLQGVARGEPLIETLENALIELDENFGRYSDNVLHRSKIRRGSNLYAWGLTPTLASNLVDVEENEILSQSGQTKMVDEEGTSVSAEKRLKNLEELL